MATHYFASHGGGIEIVAGHLFREFAASGQEVVWIATDATPPPEATQFARVVSLRAANFVERKIGLPFPIPTLKALRELRREVKDADVVIIHDCLYLTNIAAYLFAQLAGIPIIIIQHIGIVPYSNRVLREVMKLANAVFTKNMLKGAAQTVFISEITKRYFNGVHYRVPPVVVFNGVDTSVFQPRASQDEKTDLRRRFELPPNSPVVLFVGRFVEKKGLSLFQRMVARAPQFTWAFAGWGPMDPREWHAGNVHVFSDLRDSRLADLYRASDVFALPSTGEGFPLVVQEALACGLGVVCTAETATADPALERMVRAVELKPSDPEESASKFLAAILDQIELDASAGDRTGERRGFVQTHYSWHKAAQQYLNIALHLSDGTTHSLSQSSGNAPIKASAAGRTPAGPHGASL